MPTLTTFPPKLPTSQGISLLPKRASGVTATQMLSADPDGGLRSLADAAALVRKTRWEARQSNTPYNHRVPVQATQAEIATLSAYIASGKGASMSAAGDLTWPSGKLGYRIVGFARNWSAWRDSGATWDYDNDTTGESFGGVSDARPYYLRVNGKVHSSLAKPTTDELLQFFAAKWGLDEDLCRAQAWKESSWDQDFVGDLSNSDGSYSMMQIKRQIHALTYPASLGSTAFGLDFCFMIVRATYDNLINFYRTTTTKTYTTYTTPRDLAGASTVTTTYADADDIFGAMGCWFDGGAWRTSLGVTYADQVKTILTERRWEKQSNYPSGSWAVVPLRTTDDGGTGGGGGGITVPTTNGYGSTAEATSHTIPLPAHQSGDLLWVEVSTRRNQNPTTTTAGWTKEIAVQNTGSSSYLAVFWKRATSNAEPNFVLTVGTACQIAAPVLVLRGADATTLLDAAIGTTVQTSGATSIPAPSVTTVTANALVTRMVGGGAGSSTFTFPTSTEQRDVAATGATAPTAAAIGTLSQATPGASGAETITASANLAYTAITAALKAAPAATAPAAPTITAPTVAATGVVLNLAYTDATVTSEVYERSVSPYTTWTVIQNGGIDKTHTDTTIAAGTTYRYRATLVNTVGTSAASTNIEVAVPAGSVTATRKQPQYVGGRQYATTSEVTSLTTERPTGGYVGDVLIAVLSQRRASSTTMTTPTALTLKSRIVETGSNTALAWYSEVLTAASPTIDTWAQTTATQLCITYLLYRNPDTGVVVLDDTRTPDPSPGGRFWPISVATTDSDNALLLAFAAGSASTSVTFPTNWTERGDSAASGTAPCSLAVGERILPTPGTTDEGTITAVNNVQYVVQTIALQAAVLSDTPPPPPPPPPVPPPVLVPLNIGPGRPAGVSLYLLDRPNRALLADWTYDAEGLTIGYGEHGCERLSWFVPLDRWQAFRVANDLAVPWVEAWQGARCIWSGRLEDPQLTARGLQCTALGGWRAFSDVPYTAFWSQTGTAGWRDVPQTRNPNSYPDRWSIDTRDRLYLAPEKGSTHGNAPQIQGLIQWTPPQGSHRQPRLIAFDYLSTFGVGWECRVDLILTGGQYGGAAWTLPTNGVLSGGQALLLPDGVIGLLVVVFYNGAPTVAYPHDTGTEFLQLTNVRITSATLPVTADQIVTDIHQRAYAANQLLDLTTDLIEPSTYDRTDLVLIDAPMQDVLTDLAALGSASGPFEVGVDADRRLYFRPRGSAGRVWHLDDTAEVELQWSVEHLANSATGRYTDANGDEFVPTVTDQRSVARYGLVRQRALASNTKNGTIALMEAQAAVADGRTIVPRARFVTRTILTPAGGVASPLDMRPGDTIVLPWLPPSLSPDVDRLRTFVVAACETDTATGTIAITPESSLPTLERLTALIGAGLLRLSKGGASITAPRRGGEAVAGPARGGQVVIP